MANTEKKDITPQQSTPMSPFEDMERWFEEFLPSRWMHPFRTEWPAWLDLEAPFKGRFPKVNLIDRDKEILVKAELPGVKKKCSHTASSNYSDPRRSRSHAPAWECRL